ncbi:MAG: hypothetical protein NTX64_18665 [Elusimicrobia bacterium]|nr:hypothetical protein [Elusimicrobiota bacterium]
MPAATPFFSEAPFSLLRETRAVLLPLSREAGEDRGEGSSPFTAASAVTAADRAGAMREPGIATVGWIRTGALTGDSETGGRSNGLTGLIGVTMEGATPIAPACAAPTDAEGTPAAWGATT